MSGPSAPQHDSSLHLLHIWLPTLVACHAHHGNDAELKLLDRVVLFLSCGHSASDQMSLREKQSNAAIRKLRDIVMRGGKGHWNITLVYIIHVYHGFHTR